MAVTTDVVLLSHQWKEDGTNLFRIRITKDRKMRYLKTSLICHKSDLDRKGNVSTQAIKDAVEDERRKIRAIINEADTHDLDAMDVDEAARFIEGKLRRPKRFTLDFVEYGYRVAEKKSPGNAQTYYVALNALVRYFEGRHPDIGEITVRNLRGFEEFIRAEKVVKVNRITGERKASKKTKEKGRAASLYLAGIRHIYKCARMEFNDPDLGLFPIPVDPFEYYSVPKAPAAKHRDIPVETIQLMIDTRKSLEGRQRMAIDAFLMSFGLCGMNAVDMYSCLKPKKNGVLHYKRTKTTNRRDDEAEMWVKVLPCIKEIMKDYAHNTHAFDYCERYSRTDSFTTALNVELKRWATKHKQATFTFYSARHSWATIARSKRCNVDAKVVTAGLCHVDSSVDDIYVNFDWEQLWDAQKKILDVFKWK